MFKTKLLLIIGGIILTAFLGVMAVNAQTPTLSDNDLVKTPDSSAIWLIQDGKKRVFPHISVYTSWDYPEDFSTVQTVSDLSDYSEGDAVPLRDGSLFRGKTTSLHGKEASCVFFVSDGKLRPIKSGAIYQELFVDPDWEKIIWVPDDLLSKFEYSLGDTIESSTVHPNGCLIRYAGQSDIYLIEQGKKRQIISSEVFENNHFKWSDVVEVDLTETYEDGSAISAVESNLITPGGVTEPEPEPPLAPALTDPGSTVLIGVPITIEWALVSDATSYTLEVSTDNSFPSGSTDSYNLENLTSYVVSGQEAGTLYFRVKATNNYGESSWSDTVDMEIFSQINTYTTKDQGFPAIAMDSGGKFVVVWEGEDQDGDSYGIFGQRYDSQGSPLGSEFQVNTYTTNDQRYPAVAMDADGDFIVVWQSYYQDGGGYGIFAQRYNSSGVAQGLEFQVNTYTSDSQRNPAVAMDSDGDFVIVWESYTPVTSYDIFARIYNSQGVAQDAEFRVNTFATNNQTYPSVAMDADGDFVVAWTSYYQVGNNYNIFARIYDSSGDTQSAELQINSSYITHIQQFPSVAMDADGDFVVTWQSDRQDGDAYGVFSRKYNSSGVAQDVEFQVNTYTAGSQTYPSIATDSDGDFVVVWTSEDQDGSGYGIFAQRYDSSGVAQGSEFQVNTYTTSHQQYPAVVMDSDGDYVVVWQSDGQDGNGYGIFARSYK